jgi:hypothetical protein
MELVNHGAPFASRRLDEISLSDAALRTLIRNGAVRRLLRGVFVDATVEETTELRAAAVCLAVPPHVIVCRTTAAWLFGIAPLLINSHRDAPTFDLMAPAGHTVTRRTGCRGSSAQLRGDDVLDLGPVRVTSPVRTALDLARTLDRPDALAYVDAMLSAGLVTRDELWLRLGGMAGLRWVAQAREIVWLGEDRIESPMESRLRLRFIDAGFPRPAVQHVLTDGERFVARLDCAVPEQCYGFEYDGEEFHGPEHLQSDAARREAVVRQRWTMHSFRRQHVLGRSFSLERTVGEALSLEPRLLTYEARRRTYGRWCASHLSMSQHPNERWAESADAAGCPVGPATTA